MRESLLKPLYQSTSVEIPLTKGLCAIIDREDLERVNQFKWCASLESRGTKYYAIRRETINGRSEKIRMHRFILGLLPGRLAPDYVVDHKNHNPLDNRKENLEIITQEENMKRSNGWKKKAEVPWL